MTTKNMTTKNSAPAKRRFSRGDAVSHPVYGDGIVSATPYRDKASAGTTAPTPPLTCYIDLVIPFEGKNWAKVTEDQLCSRPGHGQQKYGQGRRAEPMRVGPGRYGERVGERTTTSNGRTLSHRIFVNRSGHKARSLREALRLKYDFSRP